MLDILPDGVPKKTPLSSFEKIGEKRKKSIHSSNLSFKDSLMENMERDWNERIDVFVGELDTLQEELLKKPSLPLLDLYRSKIGTFLKELFSHHQSHSFLRGRLGQKVEIKVWHSINQELSQLSQTILSKNEKGINILKHFGVLKGIVLDLKIGKS